MGSSLWRISLCFVMLLGSRALAEEIGADDVAGTVVDEEGKPIQGVQADMWTWYKGNESTTDKDGRFHIKNGVGHFKHRGGDPVLENRTQPRLHVYPGTGRQ
jgi:hypothetical protein